MGEQNRETIHLHCARELADGKATGSKVVLEESFAAEIREILPDLVPKIKIKIHGPWALAHGRGPWPQKLSLYVFKAQKQRFSIYKI